MMVIVVLAALVAAGDGDAWSSYSMQLEMGMVQKRAENCTQCDFHLTLVMSTVREGQSSSLCYRLIGNNKIKTLTSYLDSASKSSPAMGRV